MQLLDILKMIDDEVLQRLDWNDLLRLRRVCDQSLKITNGYLNVKTNADLAPEIEISEEKDKSFGAFLEMGIPTTKLFINNATLGHRFYENEVDKMRQFLEDYGPLITHLRVTEMTLANNAICRDKELTFMEGLSNLKSLEVQYCVSGRSGAELTEEIREPPEDELGINLTLPETFKQLEKVKIGRDLKDTDLRVMERKKRTRDFLMQCVHLKSVSFPTCWLSPYPEREIGFEGTECTNGTIAGDLLFLIFSFRDFNPNRFGFKIKSEANLEIIDFENCHEGYGEWLKDNWQTSLPFNFHASKGFMDLSAKCKAKGIKLSNVSPYWFYAKDAPHVEGTKAEEEELGEQVISLVGLDPIVMEVGMPNLERITIPSTNYCVTGGKRAKWPKLRILDITVDGNEGFCWNFVDVTDIHGINGKSIEGTDKMFQFLFWNVSRPSVEELYLRFDDDGGRKKNENSGVPRPIDRERFLEEGKKLRWGMEEMLTVPNTTSILKCCANLKVLKLGKWPGTNQALLVFWNGLGGTLEEVELENCGNLADFTFFGEEEDGETAAFLKLKNLKKLALKGLDKMEKVTDRLFTGILAKMELKQLLLTSDKPLEKITKDGVDSLLHGPFAQTIEKFPFKGWSLANVTPKEFEDLGKKFRSYNML